MRCYGSLVWGLLALVMFAPACPAQVTIIDDDFDLDSSSDYTVINGGVSGGNDGTLTWAFDYASLGIPPAPGSSVSSTRGVKITVNETANNGGVDETEAYTIFHNTEIVGVTDYTLTIDLFMGVWQPLALGSTEHAQIGVAGDGVTRNHLFELTDAGCCDFSGSGHFVALSSDGGDSSDYRHWKNNANGGSTPGPVNRLDPDYLSPDMDTNVTGSNFLFFEQISNINAPIPGVIGNAWATVKVEVLQSAGKIKYYVRGARPETTGNPFDPPLPPEFVQIIEANLEGADGFVNFGLADLYSSVASDSLNQFAIFDNLLVTGTNLPGGGVNGDFNDDQLWNCADADALTAAIVAAAGGSVDLAFDLSGDGLVDGDDLAAWLVEAGAENVAATGGNPFLGADANLDGGVDVSDFNLWNTNKFTNVAAFCGGDFNADGVVDVSDFNLWNGFKFNNSAGLAAVPEPSCGLMLLLLLISQLFGTWRRDLAVNPSL